MQLFDLFDPTFDRRRDEVAIEYDAGERAIEAVTFGALRNRASQMAHLLRARGFTRGDRLCVCLPNSLPFVHLFLACVKLGVIFVPINVLYRDREIGHIVGDAKPRASVTTRQMRALFPSSGDVWTVDEVDAAADRLPKDDTRVVLDKDDPLAIIYTSGTTGRSKGALLSHQNFLANTTSLLDCWQITERDRYLGVLPLFHVHGLGNGLCCSIAAGSRMRLVTRFEAARAADWFLTFRPTIFFGVPTIYVRLLELPLDMCREIGGFVRLFVSGSAPLPATVFEEFRDRFGHAILERYGMSETLMNIGNPYGAERRPGTVGFPFPHVETRIVDKNDADVRDGDVGELLVRGPNVFLGYWEQPEATAASMTDGWFRTGDLAERSADGYYTLRGRGTDMIISGGFNIYPREIEELLLELPGVREAVVVGATDQRRGEVPVAYVVADESVETPVLENACRQGLASFKMPRAFIRVDAMPRTALGKIQKHLLPPVAPAEQ